MYNYATSALVTVSTSPTAFEVGPVETHPFKLHFHACYTIFDQFENVHTEYK